MELIDRPVNDQLKSQLEFACKYIEFLHLLLQAEQKQVINVVFLHKTNNADIIWAFKSTNLRTIISYNNGSAPII